METSASNTIAGQIAEHFSEHEIYDEPELLSQNVNAVILQYLESCGLEDSYITFCRECELKGVPFPKELHTPRFPTRTFKQTDAKALLDHFDKENGDKLIEVWNAFIRELDPETSQGAGAGPITFCIHIFTAIIPHRQNQSQIARQRSMERLKTFFQDNSQTLTADATMLSMYALPFVADPMNHSVFKEIFQDSWKSKLRSQIEAVVSDYLKSQESVPGANSELTHMFISYYQQSDDESDEQVNAHAHDGKLAADSRVGRVSRGPAMDDAQVQTDKSHLVDSHHAHAQAQLQEALQNANTHNHRLNSEIQEVKAKLYQTEDRYYKLIQSTAEVVSSLELAVQGKFQSIDALSERLLRVFPELFHAHEKESDNMTRIDEPVTGLTELHVKTEPDRVHSVQHCAMSDSDNNMEQTYHRASKARKLEAPVDVADPASVPSVPKVPSKEKISQQPKVEEAETINMKPLVTLPATQITPGNLRGSPPQVPHAQPPQPVVSSIPQPILKASTTAKSPEQKQPRRSTGSGLTEKIPQGRTSALPSPRNPNTLGVYPTASHPITSGRQSVSMCPTNLRAQFQPINMASSLSMRPLPTNVPALRTQTRTIQPGYLEMHKAQAAALANLAVPPEGKVVTKAKKNFRRENAANRKDGSDQTGVDKPKSKLPTHDSGSPTPVAPSENRARRAMAATSLASLEVTSHDQNGNPVPQKSKESRKGRPRSRSREGRVRRAAAKASEVA